MADQLTEHLGHVVYNPSFRRDAASFLSLPKESVDELADLVERHGRFDVPAGDVLRFEQACDLEDQGRQVLAAAQLIRQAVRRIGPPDERRQSLIDFAALMRIDPFQPDDFSRFLSALPKLEREERRNAAVAVAPTVVESQLYPKSRGQRGEESRSGTPTRARRAGFAKDIITYIAPDFDAPLDDFADYR